MMWDTLYLSVHLTTLKLKLLLLDKIYNYSVKDKVEFRLSMKLIIKGQQKKELLIIVQFTSINLLIEMYLNRKELESVLSQLEYWNQGQNHLIFNFIGGRPGGLILEVFLSEEGWRVFYQKTMERITFTFASQVGVSLFGGKSEGFCNVDRSVG